MENVYRTNKTKTAKSNGKMITIGAFLLITIAYLTGFAVGINFRKCKKK